MKAYEPVLVSLFVAYISSDSSLMEEVTKRLEARFGGRERESQLWDFSTTGYYRDEMGAGLKRKAVSFKDLIDPGLLAEAKLFTNKLEAEFSDQSGKRRINIDPGYVALEKVVLASCKNFSHRIYIANGVYGDLTLIRKGNAYAPLEWTFPEYASGRMKDFLEDARGDYAGRVAKSVSLSERRTLEEEAL